MGYSQPEQKARETLVFAKDDNHAEANVSILREEWGRGGVATDRIVPAQAGGNRVWSD